MDESKGNMYCQLTTDFQKKPPEVFCKKGVLRNFTEFTGKHLFIKKETLAQVFSCEFCKISNNTFFTGHLQKIAS